MVRIRRFMKTFFFKNLLGFILSAFIGSFFFVLPATVLAQYSYTYTDPYYQPQVNSYYQPQTDSYYQTQTNPYYQSQTGSYYQPPYGNVLGASTVSVQCNFERNLTLGFG